MKTSALVLVALTSSGASVGAISSAHAASFTLDVSIEPAKATVSQSRSMRFDGAALRQTRWYDVQDAREHIVRGVSLRELVALAKPPKSVDTAIFVFRDGMHIPVSLSEKQEADAVFIALEHGDARDRFTATYPLVGKPELACPKVVYGRKVTTYSPWLYPTNLASINLVTWKVHEARLAQATRRLPDQSGWSIYVRHCQVCHGIGGQGATRGADFLSYMEAYRRVPPLAVTDWSEQPSLHEKVKGFTNGSMPVLNHVSKEEIATLWKWLHAIHRTATK